MIGVTNTPKPALDALRKIAADPTNVSKIDPELLKELRLAKMVYTVSDRANGRFFGHLKDAGREALERNE